MRKSNVNKKVIHFDTRHRQVPIPYYFEIPNILWYPKYIIKYKKNVRNGTTLII